MPWRGPAGRARAAGRAVVSRLWRRTAASGLGIHAALVLVAACFIAVALGRVSLLYVLPVALVLAIVASRKAWL